MKNSEPKRHAASTKTDTKIGAALLQFLEPIHARASLVPNDPVLENDLFPFLEPIESNFETILAELQYVLKYRSDIPGFEEISPDQARVAKDKKWKTFFLYGFGHRVDHNCALAPKTAELLSQIPSLKLAMFSILEPRYHIPAHVGVSKGFLRCQMGLVIPKDSDNCRMRIGTIERKWAPGEMFVFDDTFDHEVWNDTDEERIVLLFDFDRPMRWKGRLLNRLLMSAIKATSFYKVPMRNMKQFGARFEERIRSSDNTDEKKSS